MNVKTIILAAGQGTRMRSAKPKVLHKIAGKALLQHVYDTSRTLPDNAIRIVYGHGADQVLEELHGLDVEWIEQRQQLGTGHAVQQAAHHIGDEDVVLVLYGDVPLLKASTIQSLISAVNDRTLALLTVCLDDPAGYGRIIRNADNKVIKIVEEKDASSAERQINEVNTGIMAVPGKRLKTWLSKLSNDNSQQEYYLTDIIAMAVADQVEIATSQAENADEVSGVNNRVQLSHLERVYQREQAERLMESGVTIIDPSRFELRGEIKQLGKDIEIDVNVILEGEITLGDKVKIGANSIVKNSILENDCEILPNCIIEQATVGSFSRVGPFARLRPQAELGKQVHIGNFVEIKKSTVANGSKINHLSYIGDAQIGSQVNIGAGTITCNYDGVNKFQTIIEDGAFIGSNTQLVAPVTVGKMATIGAGSTITRDTPDNQLTLARARQVTHKEWKRPVKQEK